MKWGSKLESFYLKKLLLQMGYSRANRAQAQLIFGDLVALFCCGVGVCILQAWVGLLVLLHEPQINPKFFWMFNFVFMSHKGSLNYLTRMKNDMIYDNQSIICCGFLNTYGRFRNDVQDNTLHDHHQKTNSGKTFWKISTFPSSTQFLETCRTDAIGGVLVAWRGLRPP